MFIINLFFGCAGLRCCMDFSLAVCGVWGRDYLLVAVFGFLTVVAALVALRHGGFSSYSSQALEHRLSSYGAWA